ncbi:MAG: McrC family protein [Lachnospiraceae bacterium]|nr:McrC family protein [Lachnospiraceae bacterium]
MVYTSSIYNMSKRAINYFKMKLESYVAVNMKKVFKRANLEVSAQDKGHYLFNTFNGEAYKKFALIPDLVVTREDGSKVIFDTKWKRLINDKNSNINLMQSKL